MADHVRFFIGLAERDLGVTYTFLLDEHDARQILGLQFLQNGTVIELPSIPASARRDGTKLTLSYVKPKGSGRMTTDYVAACAELQAKLGDAGQ